MKTEKFLNISQFAAISGMDRKTLIYYDEIGLFSPERRAENGYRQYSHKQIGLITVIETLTELKVPLKKIKKIISCLSPKTAVELYEGQLRAIKKEIKKMLSLKDMVETRLRQVKQGMDEINSPSGFSVAMVEEDIPIYISKKIDSSKKEISDNDVVEAYNEYERRGIPFGYAMGYIVEKERILSGDVDIAANIFFELSNNKSTNGYMPKGKYAVGYARGDYGETDYIYPELLKYIKDNNFVVDGNSYELYLHDEVVAPSPDNYLLRVMIKIK